MKDYDDWQRDVLDHLEKIDDHILQIKVDIATLKVKASVWGLTGGLLGAVAMVLTNYLIR